MRNAEAGYFSPHVSPQGEMMAQRFGFTVDFLKERNTVCIPD
jgi:hypothetical protein